MEQQLEQDDRDLSLMAFDQYMRFVRWTPTLTREEEDILVQLVEQGKQERLKARPDPDILTKARQSRDRLVEGFQPLVVHIATRVARRAKFLEPLDLIQEGNIGLLQAIEDNNLQRGKPLRALAMHCINHALYYAMAHYDSPIRFGHRIEAAIRDLRKAERQLFTTLGRPPSHAELASEMGITEKKVERLYHLLRQQEVKSLQGMLFEDQDEDRYNFVSLFETEAMEERIRREELEFDLQRALETVLSRKQYEVIRLRYGFDERLPDGNNCTEVGRMIGLDKASVRQREQRGLQQLRKVLGEGVA